MPNIVIDFLSLSLIPRSHPEELNNISLCDRLNRLEERLKRVEADERPNYELVKIERVEDNMRTMQETIDRVVAENIVIKESSKTYATIAKHVPQQIQSNKANVRSPSNPSTIPKAAGATAVIDSDLDNPTDSDGFQEPADVKRRRLRQERKKSRIIRGSGTFDNIKGGPERTRDLFIYRVDKTTEDHNIHEHVTNKGFQVVKFGCISKPESMYKSYKLTVPISQFGKLFDNSLWPNGVSVRPFIAPKTKNDESND